ncbi:LLM class flavin-dependent oxidoreductase [Pseudonocardia benzenivorans]
MELPDPALVVLVGPAGAGKSAWAAARYRDAEIVSSDALRGRVGSGPADLDATDDAFTVLEAVVAARLRRGLTTVVDTLGLDARRRRAWLAAGRAVGLPCVAAVFDTPAAVCRARNRGRDRPVPAPALTSQLRRMPGVSAEIVGEGWDVVVRDDGGPAPDGPPAPVAEHAAGTPLFAEPGRLSFVLQVSRFPWGDDPASWLTSVAAAAEDAGFAGLALMDHLIQIPQVGRPFEAIPEPLVTLGLLAGATTSLHLGTLVSPVTFRAPGILAKAFATLDALSGGRAFCGLGAGWWGREHAGFGLSFPRRATASTRWSTRSRRCARCGRRAPGRPPGCRRRPATRVPWGRCRSSSAGRGAGCCGWPRRSGTPATCRSRASTRSPRRGRRNTSRSSTCPSSARTASTSRRSSSACAAARTP